jgi:hypothetical protein
MKIDFVTNDNKSMHSLFKETMANGAQQFDYLGFERTPMWHIDNDHCMNLHPLLHDCLVGVPARGKVRE